jgi:hypothetical protein
MVDRVVLIKLKDECADDAGRAEVADRSREVLPGLPGVRRVRVGQPVSGKDWDIYLNVRFDAAEDIPAYAEHPDHRAYVDEFLRPRLEVIKAWNFEVP